MNRLIALLFILILFFGCLAGRAYCWGKDKYNYILYAQKYDINESKAKFLIAVTGNTKWSEEKANDMILLSAANIALKNGYSHFAEISRHKLQRFLKVDWKVYIYCYRSQPEGYEGAIYNAEETKAELEKKYGISPAA